MKKIEIKKLYKIFGPHPEKVMPLLDQGMSKEAIMEKTRHGVGVADCSFDVDEGEILVVMGLSGSGKSTLVRCINRLIEPTSGTILVDGEDVLKLSDKALRSFRQKHFGMVFQNFALSPTAPCLKMSSTASRSKTSIKANARTCPCRPWSRSASKVGRNLTRIS